MTDEGPQSGPRKWLSVPNAQTMTDVLLYGNVYISSFIFIEMMRRLLERDPEQARGVRFHLVFDDRRDRDLAAATLPNDDRIRLYAQYEECRPWDSNGSWTPEKIREWERRYGAPHLGAYITTERILVGRPYEVRLRYLLHQIAYFEGLCRRIRPRLFMCGPAGSLPPWVAINVFQANNVPSLLVGCSRFENRFTLPVDAHENLGIGELYREKLRTGLTAEENEAVQKILSQYRARRAKPVEFGPIRKAIRPRLIPRPSRLWQNIQEYRSSDRRYYDEPLSVILGRALKARRSWLFNLLFARHGTASLENVPGFFFLPLQVEPEMSLTTQGRGWPSQLALIRLISESLPVDRWLYVKEHPMMSSGVRPLPFYRELLRLPRVRLLDQRLDSYAVIPRAEAVITLGSTAGLEALMLGKPVLLAGRAFYEEFPEGVVRLERFEDLPALLRGLRSRPPIEEESLAAFTAATLTKAPRGFLAEARFFPALREQVMGNLDGFVDVLLDRLKELRGQFSVV